MSYQVIAYKDSSGEERWVTIPEGKVVGRTVGGNIEGVDVVSSFTDLDDTPNTYTGAGLKVLRVNAGETDIEFVDVNSIITGYDLTEVDDTNVTITLGGTPVGSLLQAVSITVGWTGVLAVSRGGTGFGSYTIGDTLYADGASSLAKLGLSPSNNVLRAPNASVAPQWGKVTEDYVTLADVVTLDVSITKHGLVPKAPNDATKFLRGDGTWAVPAAGAFPAYNKIVLVDPSGNDGTGTRGQIDKPFLTLSAASTAALSGDLIIVNPGSYTSAVNVAKDGVNFYFHAGASVSITSSPYLFNLAGFATGCKVFGYGSFSTASTGGIYTSGNLPVNQTFEFHTATATITNSIEMSFGSTQSYYGLIKGVKFTTTTGNNIYLNWGGKVMIDIDWLETTHASASSQNVAMFNGSMHLRCKGSYWAVGHASAYGVNIYNSTAMIDVNNLTGGYTFTDYSIITSMGYAGKINGSAGVGLATCVHNGNVGTVTSTTAFNGITINGAAATATITTCAYFNATDVRGVCTLTNGSGKLTAIGSYSIGSAWTISAGNWDITIPPSASAYLNFTINGGTIILRVKWSPALYYMHFYIAGGEVTIDGEVNESATLWTAIYTSMFRFTGGTLRLKGTFRTQTTNTQYPLMAWTGGTLILDGAKFIQTSQLNAAHPPILCYGTSALDLRCYNGAANFTGNLYASRKAKDKCTISAVASTTIALNDGSGGTETFTEADTATYNTKAKLAQRMAALINASGTLDITASQDTPGTDEYFYVEADVAGSIACILSGPNIWNNMRQLPVTNYSATIVVFNHKAPNELIGAGTWIEDADVL